MHRIYDSMGGQVTPLAPVHRQILRRFEQAQRLLEFSLAKCSQFFGVFGESAEQARRCVTMTWVKHNIRLSPAQDRTLIRYAEQRGLTRYRCSGASSIMDWPLSKAGSTRRPTRASLPRRSRQ